VEPDDAPVVGIRLAPHQAVALHADDQAGDGRRADLFGLGEGAEGDRPSAEHQHRERGRARRGQPHRLVLAPQAAEQTDGGRMEAVGDAAVDAR
jgi:hypothetical protein